MRPVLPLVLRAEEDEAMRACAPGEQPCINDARCCGANMPRGHVLPRFRQWAECALCLRARALTAWLAGLGGSADGVIQLYRNEIGPGEYAMEATIQVSFAYCFC